MRGFALFMFILLLALPSFAQSGVDNCCQTGRACATEADWVQGWFDYQAGQCAAPAASSSAIDNCCQAGRACATDADWVQGWHDYRNGLCAAPAPVASSPAAAAPAATSSAIDNCCQAGRACATEADWVQGWHDYRNGLCAAPAPAASSPAATTTAIDNCCQAGRACASEADWVQGWIDYQNGQCAAQASTSQAGTVSASQNSYHFSGQNRVRIGPFTLTRGKWEFSPNLGRNADSFLYQVGGGDCLTFPTNFHFYGETGTGLRLRAERHEFAVRSTCQVQLYLYPEFDFDQVRGQRWSISLRKTDGNI